MNIGPILFDMFKAYAVTLDALLGFDPSQQDDYAYLLLRREHLDAADDLFCTIHAEYGGSVMFGSLRVTADGEGGITFRELRPWTPALRGGLACSCN